MFLQRRPHRSIPVDQAAWACVCTEKIILKLFFPLVYASVGPLLLGGWVERYLFPLVNIMVFVGLPMWCWGMVGGLVGVISQSF